MAPHDAQLEAKVTGIENILLAKVEDGALNCNECDNGRNIAPLDTDTASQYSSSHYPIKKDLGKWI
ncbi:hypothetical protein NFHSH190041_23760 [Shewanella sp. NFH-SH190041]|nr:hypothetical protein NFHSH190041_23760 [Shewanella sp. NFH-SH190041]